MIRKKWFVSCKCPTLRNVIRKDWLVSFTCSLCAAVDQLRIETINSGYRVDGANRAECRTGTHASDCYVRLMLTIT